MYNFGILLDPSKADAMYNLGIKLYCFLQLRTCLLEFFFLQISEGKIITCGVRPGLQQKCFLVVLDRICSCPVIEFSKPQEKICVCAPRRDLDGLVELLDCGHRILGINGGLGFPQVGTALCATLLFVLGGCARHQLRQDEQNKPDASEKFYQAKVGTRTTTKSLHGLRISPVEKWFHVCCPEPSPLD